MATRTTSRGAKGRSRASKKKTKKPSILERLAGTLRAGKTRMRERLGRQTDDVWGVVLLVGSVLILLSFFELSGPIGAGANSLFRLFFGVWVFALPVFVAIVALTMIGVFPRKDHGRIAIGMTVLFLSSMALFHLMTGALSLAGNVEQVGEHGGAVGSLIAFPLRRLIGFWGAFLVLFAVVSMGALVLTRATIRDVLHTVVDGGRSFRSWVGLVTDPATAGAAMGTMPAPVIGEPTVVSSPPEAEPEAEAESHAEPKKKSRPAPPPSPSADGYALPPLDILRQSENGGTSRRGLEETAAELEETLRQHGVDARLTRIVPGPTVTRYEIELAPGVKVSRITSLSHDIAYAMASPDVRILAPIPGRSAIGIEVPNRKRHLVTLGDILSSEPAQTDHDPMLVALGKDVSGRARMLRLTELPHVLIAGATGAGKSSCINAVVTSLLARARPDEVRMILVDPKRVELGQYNDVPHLLTRVITNPKKATDALEWAVSEMDRRYDLLADAGVRDIESYRDQHAAGALDEEMFDRFPYIVIIVDELNDLMMVSGRAVEDAIVRIAQMARAVGIHLVLATQRPSVNVITGVIKANVPSRLAFSVASQTDSRVIIDQVGAEKLVGLGDMLVVTAREPKPERIQGAFVSEAEVHAVVDYVREQQQTRYRDEELFEVAKQKADIVEAFEGEDPEIVTKAIELVVMSQLGSTSMLQRKLRIGFARAGRVMDIIERQGIVGPSEGSKARAVLITPDELDQVL